MTLPIGTGGSRGCISDDQGAGPAQSITRRHAVGLLAGGAAWLAGCGRQEPALLARPARNEWPAAFQQAPPTTQAAYRFAVSPAGQTLLRWMPCYCGCHESDGHTSNLDCYVDEFRPDGSVLLDGMSFG